MRTAHLGLLSFCEVVERVGIEAGETSCPLFIPREDVCDDRVGRGVHDVDEQSLS